VFLLEDAEARPFPDNSGSLGVFFEFELLRRFDSSAYNNPAAMPAVLNNQIFFFIVASSPGHIRNHIRRSYQASKMARDDLIKARVIYDLLTLSSQFFRALPGRKQLRGQFDLVART
jgi:hypothetical protein